MNGIGLYLVGHIIRLLPDTHCFGIKRCLYRMAGVQIGRNVRICSSAVISGDGHLSIGDNTWIGHQVLIICSNRIEIGMNCDIAPKVYIGDGTHAIDKDAPNIAGGGRTLPVIIGNGCWLCVNSCILPGSNLAEKCIVAAGSVFKGSSNPYEIWGGVLAKKIKDV